VRQAGRLSYILSKSAARTEWRALPFVSFVYFVVNKSFHPYRVRRFHSFNNSRGISDRNRDGSSAPQAQKLLIRTWISSFLINRENIIYHEKENTDAGDDPV
jgi:hypothetical protein